MMSPREKYLSDANYHYAVDVMTKLISVLASINYELTNVHRTFQQEELDAKVFEAFQILKNWSDKK